jgi:hypothetical protein
VAFLDLLKPKRPFRGLRNGVDLFNKGLFGEFFWSNCSENVSRNIVNKLLAVFELILVIFLFYPRDIRHC